MMMMVITVSLVPLFSNPGPSRKASLPAWKACVPMPRMRRAVSTVTCSWPWSSLPKSWRSRSSGCRRRRRSCSKSYSCPSLRNRLSAHRPHKAEALGCVWVMRPQGPGAEGLYLAWSQQTTAVPFFTQRCRTRDSRSIHDTPWWGAGDWWAPPPGQGEESFVTLSISCVGLQVAFLLPAVDKPQSPQVYRLIFTKEW